MKMPLLHIAATAAQFPAILRIAGLALVLASSGFAATAPAPRVPAFPGAEGAGAVTPGGRGGRVIQVTSLADSGAGTLRAALEAAGPRIVVFKLSGIITLQSKLRVNHPFLTVAGQTAPGDGICIRGHTVEINASDVVLRHLRFRRGNLTDRDDALNARSSPGRIIIDHCSFSWGLDENVSIYRNMKSQPDGTEEKAPIEQITIQWSISSEALNRFRHAFGATWGGMRRFTTIFSRVIPPAIPASAGATTLIFATTSSLTGRTARLMAATPRLS
jgi:hypothetical protein